MILVRPATSKDVPGITSIYAPAVIHGLASWELEPPDEAEMARRLETVTGAGYPWLVAENGEGHIFGYAYASSYRPRLAYRWTVENSVYVAEDAQGRGVGKLLLSSLIKACTAKGYRQMVAVIGDSANAGSIALHRSLGFQDIGTAPAVGFKHGRWLDQVMMQKALGDGATTPPV